MTRSNIVNFAKNIVHRKKMVEQTIEDLNGNSFVEVIDVVKPEPLKPSEPIPAVTDIEEAISLARQNGNIYHVIFVWRGKMMGMKMFFPEVKKPSRSEVQVAIDKVYPSAQLRSFYLTDIKYGDPYLNVGFPGD